MSIAGIWLTTWLAVVAAAPSTEPFQQGVQAYLAGGYDQAAEWFREAAKQHPASGTLHNLGNTEWHLHRPGPAILSWERALWLDPYSFNTRANLRFARKSAQLEAPDLAWYEICSTWLPVNTWAWIASLSFWGALAMVLLPGVLRWRKADWHQGVAAAGFAVFLLTLPALGGVHTRSRLGIFLDKEVPLKLTPTREGQVLAKLPAGEHARFERRRGDYYYVRTISGAGWVDQRQFALISQP